jgi:hypothetical protein
MLACVHVCPAGDVLQDMGLRDAFNVQLSVPALNGDAVTTVLRSLDCFNSGEVLQVRLAVLYVCRCSTHICLAWLVAASALGSLLDTSSIQAGLGEMSQSTYAFATKGDKAVHESEP